MEFLEISDNNNEEMQVDEEEMQVDEEEMQVDEEEMQVDEEEMQVDEEDNLGLIEDEDEIENNKEPCTIIDIQNENNKVDNTIKKKLIMPISKIRPLIKQFKMKLCVVSYGGSATNTLLDVLEKNGYSIRCVPYAKSFCHFPTYVNMGIPIIYLYSHPIKSLLSVKRRGPKIWKVNQQKLTNNLETPLSDENLLQAMINQFNSWATVPRKDVLVLKMRELFDPSVLPKLTRFLKKPLKGFPIAYKQPKSSLNSITPALQKLFDKYKNDIDKIDNFPITR